MTSVYGQSLPVEKEKPDTASEQDVGTDSDKMCWGLVIFTDCTLSRFKSTLYVTKQFSIFIILV
jgi:hypothetical protein